MQSKLMFWGQIWHLHHGHAHFFMLGMTTSSSCMLGMPTSSSCWACPLLHAGHAHFFLMHLCPAQRQCHHCGQKSHPTHTASSCSSSFLQLGQMLGVCCSVCRCTSVNSLTWKENWIILNIPSLFVFYSATFPGPDFGFVWVCELHN